LKYLAEIVRNIREGIIEGLRVSVKESSRKPIELVEEASPVQVEFYSEKVQELQRQSSIKLDKEIYALDSSSRVVETPYMFTCIGAGSVFNRFTGFALDVPSLLSIMGLEEPLCKHIVLIPEIEYSQRFTELISSVKSIIQSNPNNIPYTSEYNKNIILAELRASIENCLLENFSKIVKDRAVLFVDGPTLYPEKIVGAVSTSREMLELYTNSIRTLNNQRAMFIKKLLVNDTLVINIVKRLHRSYYLSTIDPLDLKISGCSDETYLTTALIAGKIPSEKPVAIGPLIIRQQSEYSVNRAMWYLVIPRRIHSYIEGLGNYVFYRVETLEDCFREPVLEIIIQDSIQIGSFLPLTLLVVDRRVKKISSSITTYFLYLTGLTSEATEHYISIL
jgi:hypothetical protein